MVYFTSIRPTKHYLNEHQKDVPWYEVVEVILLTKNPRKNGNTFEIENNKYYIVFKIHKNALYIINAKRLR